MRIHPLVSAILALTFSSAPAFGCKCVPPPPDIKTARELAELTAKGSDAIFEGRVERIELKWAFMEAKVGDVISADVEEGPPVMQVSFDVLRSYRGAQQKNVRIRTGVGGGDCGFDFEVGKQYLVYAFADKSGQLTGFAVEPHYWSRARRTFLICAESQSFPRVLREKHLFRQESSAAA